MKTNPYLLILLAAGGALVLIGLVLTLMRLTGAASMDEAETLSAVSGLLLSLGAPALVGGAVLAGVEWRLSRS